jgi:hypothetical protein
MEEELAGVVRWYCKSGSVIESKLFKRIAEQLYIRRFPNSDKFKASNSWLKGFSQRCNLEEHYKPANKALGIHRRISCVEAHVEDFIGKFLEAFALYRRMLAAHLGIGVPDLEEQHLRPGIFVMDETCLSNHAPLSYEPRKIVPKGAVLLENKISGRSTICASLLEVYTAAGSLPFHVLTTKQPLAPEEHRVLSAIDTRSVLYFCDLMTGSFDAASHATALRHIGELRQGEPTLLIQDAPNSHMTSISFEAAREHNIIVVCLPHNSSWWLQVPDDLPFALTKRQHYNLIEEWNSGNPGRKPNMFETIRLFLTARKSVLTSEIIIRSFERCGQYPPSDRQIRSKAEQARQRCSGSKKWVETDDLVVIPEVSVAELQSFTVRLGQLSREISRTTAGRRISNEPEALHLISEIHTQNAAVQNQIAEQTAAALHAAQVQLRSEAHQSTPDAPPDPELFTTFYNRDLAVFPRSKQSLEYFQAQMAALKTVLSALKEIAAREKATRSGHFFPPTLIPTVSKIEVRKSFKQKLSAEIASIRLALKDAEKLKKKCLNLQCAATKGRSRNWSICPVCERGVCPLCTTSSSWTEHGESCSRTAAITITSTTTTMVITQQPILSLDQIVAIQSTSPGVTPSISPVISPIISPVITPVISAFLSPVDSPLILAPASARIISFATSSTCTTVPSPAVGAAGITLQVSQPVEFVKPRGKCVGCGMLRSLFECIQGHLNCVRCSNDCLQCNPKRRRMVRTPHDL